MRYVILGAGVAGFAAIESIRQADTAGEISIVSDDPNGFYSRPGLAYYLSGEIDGKALYPRSREDYRALNFAFINARARKILRDGKKLELEGKPALEYDRLLIATGARAIPLNIPGADLSDVVKLDHLADANTILALAKRGRTAIVTGGGITALELTEGLLARGMAVHYLLRGERYWSNVLDARESQIVEARLQADGVVLHYHAEVTEVVGRHKRVIGARLKDGTIIKCDLFAYAVGIAPRMELAQDCGLACERGILADERLQTNDEHIFAAGDVAQVYDPLTGHSTLDSLWNLAREQGRVAGLNMAGRRTAYLKSAPFNVTRLAGLTTTIIGTVGRGRDEDVLGIARGDSETWRELPEAIVAQGGFDVNHVRLLLGENHIIGAVLMGDQKLSLPLQKMVTHKTDISSIRDMLLQPNAPIADVLADFWVGQT
ncbi:MAG: NAD(P)/FAD-dependent oxidoreductase [Chloroflexi bacterium]|nr:NAD(P)/FAD-dependent oxidoreductase [Chloroflexota bacterium]